MKRGRTFLDLPVEKSLKLSYILTINAVARDRDFRPLGD
jgi:hypothetical protein